MEGTLKKPYYNLVMAEFLNGMTFLKKAGFSPKGLAPDGVSEEERWEAAKKDFYQMPILVISEWGLIDFDPNAQKYLVGGKDISYDNYLELMKNSGHKCRQAFMSAYYDASYCKFKGRVEKINRKKEKVCFERIFISGEYDGGGGDGFFDKEDHVWMDLADFPSCKKGDCFSFAADIYRYVKTGSGKMIDFGLRNPESIEQIGEYRLPSDEPFLMQEINETICSDLCSYREHCNGVCIANQDWIDSTRTSLLYKRSPELLLNMLGLM